MELNKVSINTIKLNQALLSHVGERKDKKRNQTITYLSLFGNGVWEDEGRWFNSDTWRNEIQNQPFLSTGFWNNEGIYRFKDAFSYSEKLKAKGTAEKEIK